MTEITDLKFALQSVDKELAELGARVSSLKKEKDDLQVRIDNTVVDGLRMKVRNFISQATEPVKLRRLQQIKWEDRTPFLQDQSVKWSWHFCTLTEEEALYLWRHNHEYNIDISEWVTYRAPREID